MQIRTKLTEMLGIKYPIIQGCMQWFATADLAAAAPGVELKFVEGAFTLGGLVLDCAEAGRKIDLTFDAALEDLEGRFSEITGFSLEDADGK